MYNFFWWLYFTNPVLLLSTAFIGKQSTYRRICVEINLYLMLYHILRNSFVSWLCWEWHLLLVKTSFAVHFISHDFYYFGGRHRACWVVRKMLFLVIWVYSFILANNTFLPSQAAAMTVRNMRRVSPGHHPKTHVTCASVAGGWSPADVRLPVWDSAHMECPPWIPAALPAQVELAW